MPIVFHFSKIERLSYTFLILFLMGCSSPKYLPKPTGIDENPFGSYLKIFKYDLPPIKGELIAIENKTIIVLNENTNQLETIPFNEIKTFKLRYAKPKHYGWTIPIFLIYPFIHGYYSFFTIPVHLAATISLTILGENAYQYSDKNMTYDQMKMFARFPQGVPEYFTFQKLP